MDFRPRSQDWNGKPLEILGVCGYEQWPLLQGAALCSSSNSLLNKHSRKTNPTNQPNKPQQTGFLHCKLYISILNLSVLQFKWGKVSYLLISKRCSLKQSNMLHFLRNSDKYRGALRQKSTRKLSFKSKIWRGNKCSTGTHIERWWANKLDNSS